MRYDPDLGLAVRQLRHSKGVTQESLADRIDVSASTLCSLERGLIDPPWSRVRAIARALDVEMDELGAAVEGATA
jgi:transcriptional regulator with XRE-family HTH domain